MNPASPSSLAYGSTPARPLALGAGPFLFLETAQNLRAHHPDAHQAGGHGAGAAGSVMRTQPRPPFTPKVDHLAHLKTSNGSLPDSGELRRRFFQNGESFSMAALAEKLAAIGGSGPLKKREWRIRCRLGWHDKAASAVRHLLHRERIPTFEEAKQIEAAYLKYCAERIDENQRENAALLRELQSALVAMEASDPEFFEPTIEAVRAILLQRRAQAAEPVRKG